MLALVRDNLCILMQLLIVGKSTFLKIMEKFPGVKVFPEPVENWQKVWIVCLIMRLALLFNVQVGSQNLLNDMFANPMRWTTAFQLYSSLTRQVFIFDFTN